MSNIEDTAPVDCLASRVWAGRNYAYPHLERMVSEMKTMRKTIADHAAELARVEGERDAAQARVDALEADAMKAMHDAGVLKRFEYNRVGDTGSIEAVVQSPFMRILAEWIAADFKANGGTNYVEQELSLQLNDHTDYQIYTVLVQKAGGKTPAQVAGELRKENALLRAECEAWRAADLRHDWIRDNTAGGVAATHEVDCLICEMNATDAANILKGAE